MLYEFKSRRTGTVTMTQSVAERLLEIMGKTPGPAGIITVEQIPVQVTAMVKEVAGNKWVFLLLINIVLLVLGIFLEPLPALILTAPILVPMARDFGIDLVHLGLLVTCNLAIGLYTPPVGGTLLGRRGEFLFERRDLVLRQEGEVTQEPRHIGVGLVDPELVKLVGGRPLRVKPHVAGFGLAELRAVGLGDQRQRDAEGLALAQAAGKVHARDDVAPLVAPANLEAATETVMQVQKIVRLKQAVGELGVRNTVLAVLEPCPHRFL